MPALAPFDAPAAPTPAEIAADLEFLAHEAAAVRWAAEQTGRPDLAAELTRVAGILLACRALVDEPAGKTRRGKG